MQASRQSKVFSWLLGSVFLDHLSLNIVFPALTLVCFDLSSPLFHPDTSLVTRAAYYGWMVALYHFGNMVATPLLAIISDHSGRRLILMLGAIGALLMACSGVVSLWWGVASVLLLGRLVGGVCATRAVSQAAVGDLVTTNNSLTRMGYLQAAIACGAFMGPLLGGYVAQHTLTAPFYVAAVMALLSLWIVVVKLDETQRQRTAYRFSAFYHNMKRVLAQPKILKISLLLFLSQCGWSFYYQYIPPILKQEFGFSASQLGWFLSLIALWLIAAAAVGVNYLQRRLAPMAIIRWATLLSCLGLLLTLVVLHCKFLEPYGVLWLAALPVAVGDVLAYSVFTSLYASAAQDQGCGLVMGICVVVAQLVWGFTGLLGGLLVGIHTSLPIWAALCVMTLLWLVLQPRLKGDYFESLSHD